MSYYLVGPKDLSWIFYNARHFKNTILGSLIPRIIINISRGSDLLV